MANEILTSTFTRLKSRLHKLSAFITGNDDDAADVLQEAFCRLWGRHFVSEEEAAGIAYVTVRNLSVDVVRRRLRAPEDSLDDACTVVDPIDIEEPEALYAAIKAIIENELKDDQKEIIRMREFQGLTDDEIAQSKGIEPGTVRVQLSRARKKVREIYRKKGGKI